MKINKIILITLALGFILTACVKEQPLPDLPPSESMVLEVDNIWVQSPGADAFKTGVPQSNFIFAAANVYWWNIVLTVQMVVPVAAYLESFNHDAVWDRTSLAWVWSYTVDVHNTSYTAELFAESKTDEVHWSMYLSKEDGFTDLLWFTGISKNDGSSGSWIIHKDPDSSVKDLAESVPFLEIVWNANDAGITDIKYTNIEENSQENGSYIEFGMLDDPVYDAFYDIYRVWEENMVSIKWNSSTHEGRVLSMEHFQDPYWHCWDELFQNKACD